jgi:hypothetical protein
LTEQENLNLDIKSVMKFTQPGSEVAELEFCLSQSLTLGLVFSLLHYSTHKVY